jgi:hypothetical protein
VGFEIGCLRRPRSAGGAPISSQAENGLILKT